MFPEAKLAMVNAMKKDDEVVAMLGDGVNDAPVLKAAHVGVAMGYKGTEIAKAAASLVFTNDNLDKLVVGIAAGRRIFANIFLSLVNRSLVSSVLDSFKYKNRLFPLIIGATLILLFAILYIPIFANFFHITSLHVQDLGMTFLIAGGSVLWFEIYKWIKRRK